MSGGAPAVEKYAARHHPRHCTWLAVARTDRGSDSVWQDHPWVSVVEWPLL